MGMEMPAWFDIESFDFKTEDERGMLQTVHQLNQLITAEVDAGTPADRIVLGGFSQGGAVTLLTGLTTERKLGGLTVLSGWVPLKSKIKSMASDHVKKLPIFWGHGKADPLVRHIWGVQSAEFLKDTFGIKTADESEPKLTGITFRSYDGVPHSTSEAELEDLQKWLQKVIPQEA
ncbi:unnamed protein product [Somion occarium]